MAYNALRLPKETESWPTYVDQTKYCPFHRGPGYTIKDCYYFRDYIYDLNDAGKINWEQLAQIIAQSSLPKAQPEMGIVNNPLPNHPQNQAPVPQPGQYQNPQQPPNVAIILNPDEQVPLPQGRQVWDFDNAHDVQTLLSDSPRVRTPLPPFLNPTPKSFLQPNIRVPFLNPNPPNFNLPFIIPFQNQESKSPNPLS